MTRTSPIYVYSITILRQMTLLEILSDNQGTFSDLYPRFEADFWKAINTQDLDKLVRLNEALTDLITVQKGSL